MELFWVSGMMENGSQSRGIQYETNNSHIDNRKRSSFHCVLQTNKQASKHTHTYTVNIRWVCAWIACGWLTALSKYKQITSINYFPCSRSVVVADENSQNNIARSMINNRTKPNQMKMQQMKHSATELQSVLNAHHPHTLRVMDHSMNCMCFWFTTIEN